MSLIPHHTSDPVCPLCELKLKDAHDKLGEWFRDMKGKHPSLHISWSYRDKASQEQAVSHGASKLHYPASAHNKMPSLALDVFQIDESGRASFDPVFCAKLNSESQAAGYTLKWGGQWKSLGDSDHFQITC